MSAIREALTNLSGAIGTLEASVSGIEGTLEGAQRDMFPETKQAVVKSLDKVIDQVEKMLVDA